MQHNINKSILEIFKCKNTYHNVNDYFNLQRRYSKHSFHTYGLSASTCRNTALVISIYTNYAYSIH